MVCLQTNNLFYQNARYGQHVCHYRRQFHYSFILPIFCACLIAALGIAAGMRQVVFMQFDIDADTEYICSVKMLFIDILQISHDKWQQLKT